MPFSIISSRAIYYTAHIKIGNQLITVCGVSINLRAGMQISEHRFVVEPIILRIYRTVERHCLQELSVRHVFAVIYFNHILKYLLPHTIYSI